MRWNLRLAVLIVLGLAACGPSGSSGPNVGRTGAQETGSRGASAPKAITIGLDEDVKNLWDSITSGGGSGTRELANIVNQHLVAIGADGSPHPRLLNELPSLERGTWRLLPDGKMETTWKLRPNVFWHDGTAFTSEDVVFSWYVNKDPDVPNANQEAVRLIERMETPDRTTIVTTWLQAYPFADRLEHRELMPLPRHLLERTYQDSKDALLALPYFSTDYVGLGPYRVARWEMGSHIDLAAFDQYFMGHPNIQTVRVQFITDLNTMLANLRAHTIQVMVTLGGIPDFDALMALKREWEATGYGTMVMDPISYRFVEPQKYHNPTPPDLVDPRVRRALLLAINRPELAVNNFGEYGVVADSWVHPSFTYYPQVQNEIEKFAYDPRQASALLAEAGWRPGPGGIVEKGGQQFAMTMRDFDGERDALIIASNWKEIGVLGSYERRTAAAMRDRQDRATFSGVDIVSNPMGPAAVVRRAASYNVPTAENRWTGTNRGGYSNPAWDDLERRMLMALDERTRLDLERELIRIFNAEVPLLPLYFRYDVVPVGGGLTGVVPNTGVAHRGFILHTWNIHEWDVKPTT